MLITFHQQTHELYFRVTLETSSPTWLNDLWKFLPENKPDIKIFSFQSLFPRWKYHGLLSISDHIFHIYFLSLQENLPVWSYPVCYQALVHRPWENCQVSQLGLSQPERNLIFCLGCNQTSSYLHQENHTGQLFPFSTPSRRIFTEICPYAESCIIQNPLRCLQGSIHFTYPGSFF